MNPAIHGPGSGVWRLRLVSLAILAGLVMAADSARAQQRDREPSILADYVRAERFLSWNASSLLAGDRVDPIWLGDGRFWYMDNTGSGHRYMLVDPERRSKAPVFDHARLASAMSLVTDTSYNGDNLPFTYFDLVAGGSEIQFYVEPLVWTCDIQAYVCAAPDTQALPPADEVPSPDGKWVAFARDHNLWIRATDTGEEVQLSRDGELDRGYGDVPQGCCSAVGSQREGTPTAPVVSWSPDGTKIATHRYDQRDVAKLHLLEAKTGRPTLYSYHYALPGDSVLPTYELYIFDVTTRAGVRVDGEPAVGDFSIAFSPSWLTVQWSPTGDRLFFTRHDASFRNYDLMVADATTGETGTIVHESRPTFVDLTHIFLLPPLWQIVSNGSEAIWFSERDGWGHLYLYDTATGELKNRITSGPWLTVGISSIDEVGRWIYLTGDGREPGVSPYLPRLYKVRYDGTGFQLLTPEDADHAVHVAPSARYFVDTYSRRNVGPVTTLRSTADGSTLMDLGKADLSRLLDAGWQMPVPFRVKARDGITDLYGYLHFPSNFDPSRTYPVVDHVYPGPQIGAILTRSFTVQAFGEVHALAELGFIVVTMDAFGTPLRSKAFHDFYYGRLGDNGLPDHVVALRQLASRYPQMDLSRVGIYGHSGGGAAAAAAILKYPDVFKVAVASAGNHDNRAYYFPWGNKYQGPLVRDSVTGSDNYAGQANQEAAANLKGKLLLVYGTLDDNVHPNATLVLMDSLISANREFDVIVMPNRDHGYLFEPYVIRRTWDYFVRHLRGVEPPPNYEIKPPG